MSTAKLAAIVINAMDLEAVAEFWKGFLEVEERHRLPGFVWLERQPGASLSLAVQQVDDPTEGRNRLHIDFGVKDVEEARARVIALGGEELEQHEIGAFGWTVLADVEGNEFCIAQADPDDYA